MSRAKFIAELTRAVERADGTVEITAQGHLKVTGPRGVAFVGSTVAGHTRARHQVRRAIAKYAGLELS